MNPLPWGNGVSIFSVRIVIEFLNWKLRSLINEGLALGAPKPAADDGGNSASNGGAASDAKNRSQGIVSVAFSGGRRATSGSLASTLGNKIKKLQKSEDWKVL